MVTPDGTETNRTVAGTSPGSLTISFRRGSRTGGGLIQAFGGNVGTGDRIAKRNGLNRDRRLIGRPWQTGRHDKAERDAKGRVHAGVSIKTSLRRTPGMFMTCRLVKLSRPSCQSLNPRSRTTRTKCSRNVFRHKTRRRQPIRAGPRKRPGLSAFRPPLPAPAARHWSGAPNATHWSAPCAYHSPCNAGSMTAPTVSIGPATGGWPDGSPAPSAPITTKTFPAAPSLATTTERLPP